MNDLLITDLCKKIPHYTLLLVRNVFVLTSFLRGFPREKNLVLLKSTIPDNFLMILSPLLRLLFIERELERY